MRQFAVAGKSKPIQNTVKLIHLDFDELEPDSPCIMQVNYHLKAFDRDKRHHINMVKKKCAFFVGNSTEGLLALGTVRALLHPDVPDSLLINGTKYKLELFMSPDGKSIRTFYPVFR